MTKERAAISYERALAKIGGAIGWPEVARICQRSERTVRNWSDADTQGNITMEKAELLDVAWRQAGGESTPMWEVYTLRLELACSSAIHCKEVLATTTAKASKESGEALAALICASLPNAGSFEREDAKREVEEAIAALQATLHHLGGAPCNHDHMAEAGT